MADLLLDLVARKGREPALIDEVGATSWTTFNERVNRLVHGLRDLGLQAGDTIGVLVGNRREAFELMMAGLHSSWVLVPINWHFAVEEVAYVLQDSGARALVLDGRFLELGAEAVAQLDAPLIAKVLLDGAQEGFVGYEDVLAAGDVAEPADQAAGGVMFYTSGTTGRPKGVRSSMLQIGGPLGTVQLMGQGFSAMLGVPADGVTLICGPAYHSAQWAFVLFPLAVGSTIVSRHRFDAAETLEVIDRHGVTNVHFVPTQLVRLLRLPDEVRAGFDGGSLVVAFHGAAPCPPDVKRRMIDWWGPKLVEYYGATEGAIVSLIDSEAWLLKPGSVGKVIPTTEIQVLAEDGTRAGPHEEGQLYFRSLMGTDFEYHNDPEKTAAAHLAPGVYTFGDIGYLDEDGYLFMSDRKIDMIISGGVNIYPAEIEGVLIEHEDVADVAVFGIPNEEFGEEVKAAIQLAPGSQADDQLVARLLDHARGRLAGYKVPRSIDVVDELPRTETGKLQKRLLRDPYWVGSGRRI